MWGRSNTGADWSENLQQRDKGATNSESIFSLDRSVLAQASTASHKNTLGLLPIGKKGKQKFVIGDDAGDIKAYEMKRGEAQQVFAYTDMTGPVTALTVTGEKVFATQGSHIVGVTKKGKEFFKLTSSLSETMHHLAVDGTKIFTGCEYIFNLYDDGRDAAFYMCHDRINALTIAPLYGSTDMNTILGCQDRCLRILNGQSCEVQEEFPVDSPVSALHVSGGTSSPHKIYYGTDAGSIGCLDTSSNALVETWKMDGQGEGSYVVGLQAVDMTGDGVDELVIGRGNGVIQVVGFPNGNNGLSTGREQLLFETNIGESLRSLQCGMVSTQGFQEVVACGFSGTIVSYTTESLGKVDGTDQMGRTIGAVQSENKIRQLQKEIQDLEKKLIAEKEKASKSKSSEGEYTCHTQQFQAISSCSLDAEAAAYRFSVEIPVPIDIVILQSSVHLDLLDTREDSQVAATCTVNPMDPERPGMLATYRCQDETCRLVIRARTTEGDYGEVSLTVVALTKPAKTAQRVRFKLKPLSLHHRVHALPGFAAKQSSQDQDVDSEGQASSYRQMNSLRLTGVYTLNTMHDWIGLCLPDVPPRAQQQDDRIVHYFVNAFTGSALVCDYKKGEAIFYSDNASALAILRELIVREATQRRIHITDTFQACEESVPRLLRLVHPKLEALNFLAQQHAIIEAIREIVLQDTTSNTVTTSEGKSIPPWLMKEYADIYINAERIQKEFKERPRALEYVGGIITDLFVDWHKLKGHDVRQFIPDLQLLLPPAQSQYNIDSIVAFFQQR